MKHLTVSLFISIVLLAALVSCSPQLAAATPTARVPPSDTPIPTATATDTPTPGPTHSPTSWERRLTVDGVERSYILHIPPGVDSARPAPVVFVFHGAGGEPAEIQYVTGFSDIANQSGFFIIYAHGLGRTWNAGSCCGYAVENNVDDIAYVRQVLTDVETVVHVDPNRIYAAGFSNGAGMVYRLACEMPDTFAAIATVAGAPLMEPCEPSGPVSLMHIHGLEDTVVPFAGGGELNIKPIEETINAWVQVNGCSGSPQVETEEIVTHTRYPSCEEGTTVELHTIEAGGHVWPTRHLWDGTQIIWEFFTAHPKQ